MRKKEKNKRKKKKRKKKRRKKNKKSLHARDSALCGVRALKLKTLCFISN